MISRRWRKTSLRTQLVVITTGLLLLALVITTVVSVSLFRQELLRSMDEDINANAQSVNSYIFNREENGVTEYEDFRQIHRFSAWVVDAEGHPIEGYDFGPWESEALDRPQLPQITIDEAQEMMGESITVPGALEDSRGYRLQAHPLSSGDGSLLIALPMSNTETSVERVTFLVATIGLLAVLGASILAYSVVTRAFRPLFRVERTAGRIAAGDFSQRVHTTAPPETEIGRLAGSLNVMLEHIEQAFDAQSASEQKMRRFIQDASHELRTPLVTIRGFSELYRQGGISDNPEAVGAAMGRIESEATRLGDLVDDLLTLARLDEQRPLEKQPMDLNIVAHEAVMDVAVNAPDREVKVVGLDGDPPRPAHVLGDESRIRQIVTNLTTNALRYTPVGTPIELGVGVEEAEDGQIYSVLQVCDHGDGIGPEDARRIFQRFYRADNSRQRETGGTGLGLAICAAIAAQHGGSVRHSDTAGGGATMTLRLPQIDPPEDTEIDDDDALEDAITLDADELEKLREAALQSREN